MDITICPYCGTTIKPGRIFAKESSVPYWLPDGAQLEKILLSGKAITEANGLAIGKASKIGFIQKECVLTSYCKTCNVLITFMGKNNEQLPHILSANSKNKIILLNTGIRRPGVFINPVCKSTWDFLDFGGIYETKAIFEYYFFSVGIPAGAGAIALPCHQ